MNATIGTPQLRLLSNDSDPNGKLIGSPGETCQCSDGTFWEKTSGEQTNTGWTPTGSGAGVQAYLDSLGSYYNDTEAGAAGVAINGYYINTGTGAVTKKLT